MKIINKVSVSRELPKVRHGQKDASTRYDRAKRKVEHYASEGFELGVRHGNIVPFLDREGKDYSERLAAIANLNSMDHLEEVAKDLPLSFGSRLLKRSDLKIGITSGPTIAGLLEGTADLIPVSPFSSNEVIDEVDLLIVGMPVVDRDDAWSKATLDEIKTFLFPRVRERKLPIVVVTTSDPMRTNATITLAKDADFLLTTDPDGTEAYESKLPQTVQVEHFYATFNPLFVSPVGRERFRAQSTMVSGKLPGVGQRQRFQALRGLLTGLRRESESLIAPQGDLVCGLEEKKTGLYPSEFSNFLTRDADPSLRTRVMRLPDVHVLTHLHPGSSFAHPQETLEVLASGGAAMSTYAVGMNNEYPHVLLPDGPDDAQLQIRLLRSDPGHLRDLQMEGVRRAFSHRTSDRLLEKILNLTGLDVSDRKIQVAWRGAEDDSDLESWENQILPHGVEAVRIRHSDVTPPGAQIVVEVPRRLKARHYLIQDVINGFRMASVDTVCLSASADYSQVFDIIDKPNRQEDSVIAYWAGGGVSNLRGAFRMDGSSIIPESRSAPYVGKHEAPELSVIVPVYNNGPYLLRKCLESLRRSSAFDRMEIILVDDGSTRSETRRIVEESAELWPNVRAYLFPPGGSGSASRPRNYGLSMVRTPWVTYLDPDNEGVGDGYADLLEKCQDTGVDFAIGDMLRYAKTRTLTRNVGILRSVIDTDENGVGDVPSDVLPRISFQPMSIQALVANTEWLNSLGIEQPLGALGQDSLFFQQMLQGARRIALVDKPIHTYYGEVAGSMVNSVSPTFFRKYVPLENARSEWLKQDGLFQEYVDKRMKRYVSVWFLPKFNNAVRAEDKDECFSLLNALCEMYHLPLIRSEDGQKATLR